MPYDLNHPVCISKILLFTCKTIQAPWKFAAVTQTWREAVDHYGLGAEVWKRNNFLTLPRNFRMTEQTKIFKETAPAYYNFTGLPPVAAAASQQKHKKSSSSSSSSSPTSPTTESTTFLQVLTTEPFFTIFSIGNSVVIYARYLQMSGFRSLSHIGNSFQFLNSIIVDLDFTGVTSLKIIGNYFCAMCYNLKKIKFDDRMEVESIGSQFLQCTAIEEIDLSFLSSTKFKKFPQLFLSSCQQLKKIHNINTVKNCLEEIDHEFLEHCFHGNIKATHPLVHLVNNSIDKTNNNSSSTMTVLSFRDLPKKNGGSGNNIITNTSSSSTEDHHPFSSLSRIGNHFESGNYLITALDFSNLKNLKTIGSYFCESATSLKRVSFSSEANVEQIGRHFLSKTAIEEIDLSFLSPTAFTRFYTGFLENCKQLKRIKNLSRVHKCLKMLESNFLEGCCNLEAVDFCGGDDGHSNNNIIYPNLEAVTFDGFLGGCTSLKELNLSGFVKAKFPKEQTWNEANSNYATASMMGFPSPIGKFSGSRSVIDLTTLMSSTRYCLPPHFQKAKKEEQLVVFASGKEGPWFDKTVVVDDDEDDEPSIL